MKGEMRILDRTGHTSVRWDTEVEDGPLAPEVAEREFNRLVNEGHMVFALRGGENVQIASGGRAFKEQTFDPTQDEQLTVVPAFVGG